MLHDCSKCEASGDCPLENISSWVNDHNEEVEGAIDDQSKQLSIACAFFERVTLLGKVEHGDILHLAVAAFTLGYYEGRQFIPIPKVFEKM